MSDLGRKHKAECCQHAKKSERALSRKSSLKHPATEETLTRLQSFSISELSGAALDVLFGSSTTCSPTHSHEHERCEETVCVCVFPTTTNQQKVEVTWKYTIHVSRLEQHFLFV